MQQYKPPATGEAVLVYPQMIKDLIAERREAADAAPFDAEPLVDLALNLASYGGAARQDRLSVLKQAVAMVVALCGQSARAAGVCIIWGVDCILDCAPRRDSRPHGNPNFCATISDKLPEWYRGAAELYPLNPGLRVDARRCKIDLGLVLAGRLAHDYEEAFDTDMLVGDANVYLSAIFTDPRPGAFSRHGFEGLVLRELNKHSDGGRGLLIRRVVALAELIRAAERNQKTAEADELRDELNSAARELLAASSDDKRVFAHAALLYALSFEMTGKKDGRAEAWQEARRLQSETAAQNTPGTPPAVFSQLAAHYGNRQP